MGSAETSIINIVGAQDLAIYGVPEDTLFKDQVVTYTNFSYSVRDVTDSNSVYKSNTDIKYNLQGNGDILGKIHLRARFPALKMSDGTGTAAHYVNAVGFAMIDYAELRIGGQAIGREYGRRMELLDELVNLPGQRLDEMVGRLDNESALIANAQSDTQVTVPMSFPCCRWLQSGIPAIALHHTQLEFVVRLNKLADITANIGNSSGIPHKFGTSASIQESDIDINVFATFYLLDEWERYMYSYADHKYLWHQSQYTVTDVSDGAAAGSTISMKNVVLVHPTRHVLWMYERSEATDNSTRTKRSVGINDPFDYSADHGGESLYSPKLTLNGQTVWSENLYAAYFRTAKMRDGWPAVSNRNVYGWNFGIANDEWNPTQTVNMSRIEKIAFDVKLNTTATADTNSSTSGGNRLHFFTEVCNVLYVSGGMGGVPFGS